MPRLHLFEFEDLDWFPQSIRNYLTEVLSHLLIFDRTYAPIIPRLTEAIQRSGCRRVLDLCSGSGGPSLAVLDAVNRQLDEPVEILLSDKFPNREQLALACAGYPHCGFVAEPVDALDPAGLAAQRPPDPARGGEFRTMFTALHHFRPDQVAQILADAVRSQVGIGLFEFTERAPAQIVASLCSTALLSLAVTPRLRPWSLARLFWTYLVPVVPLTFAWDGLVSTLRSYGRDELAAIVNSVPDADSYIWDIGRSLPAEQGIPFRITYLLGRPRR
jgi:hypothetical protein